MKRGLLTVSQWVVLALLSGQLLAQTIHPGKTGDELARLLRREFVPQRTLSYSDAKMEMFTRIDNHNGKVRLVYTGAVIQTNTVPDENVVNTEHTWPQSKFGPSAKDKKSDLHHLFPTYNKVNGDRGNKPFADIPDNQTKKWWNKPQSVRTPDATLIDTYSESTNTHFEPREDHKGNVARAMFYFHTIYGERGIELSYFDSQRDTLLRWHLQDPVDAVETARNAAIARVQGNRNPFIDDSTLAQRVYSPNRPTPHRLDSAPHSAARRVAIPAGGTLQAGDEIDVVTWNLKFFFDADTQDNFSNLGRKESAETDADFQARVAAVANVIAKLGFPDILALQEIENKKVVERLAKELNDKHDTQYQVGFIQGNDTFTEQDVAFLYAKRDVSVEFSRIPEGGFSNTNLYNVPSKHLVMTVKHRFQNGVERKLSLINCHLKAGGFAGEAQRKKQARVVNQFAAHIMRGDPTHAVVILGDMNAGRPFAQTAASDGMGVMTGLETLGPEDDFVDLHGELTEQDRATHVSNRELDRILLSNALLDDIGLVFQQVVVHRDLVTDESDHFPVRATFVYQEK